ncbi:MAG: carboxymuconolactone decarboxylase family protein, partial [Myxococcota bacterium]
MPHVEPLPRSELAEFEPVFESIESLMGFVPNSLLTLGRSPEILRGFGALSAAVLGHCSVDPALR